MGLDPKLQKYTTASQILVNIDSGDFTTGLGYVEFFCFESTDNTSIKYNILNKALRGSDTHTIGDAITLSFTSSFGVTQIMDGEAYCQFHWGYRSNGNPCTSYATISIEKNGVEIATQRGTDLAISSGQAERTEVISLDIPNTTFSPGDTFKIKIVIIDPGPTTTDGVFLAHDPLDTTFTPTAGSWSGTITETDFKLNIPFQFI